MANPQPTDAHLRVAHSINEAIMMRDFSKRQRKILDLILRLSWGCNKKTAIIPRQKDFSVVGINEVDIKEALDWLEVSKIIYREGFKYSFNKNFDDWQVSRVNPFQPELLSNLLSFNLNGKTPQLSKRRSYNLVKDEVSTSQNTKSITPNSVSSKEKVKKVLKKEIYIVPEYPNIKISKEEHQKLIERFGEDGTADKIENLALYIASIGDKYKSHYHTILSWSKKDQKGGQGGEDKITVETQPVLISGQSIEKAIRIARGEQEATKHARQHIQYELDAKGIKWEEK